MLWQAFGRWGALGVQSGGPVSTQAPVPVVLVNRATATAITDANPVTYTNEVYDPESVIAVTSSTFTIPSSGLYRVMSSASNSTNSTGQALQKNSADVLGGLACVTSNTVPRWSSSGSAILNLASSDTLRLLTILTSNYGQDAANYTATGIERLQSNTQYALVSKSADQNAIGTSPVAATFATETADVGGWFDPGLSTRLTSLPNLTRVRVCGNVKVTAEANIEIRKNGSSQVLGMPARRRTQTGTKYMNVFGPPVNVNGGTDYFELYVTSGDTACSILNDAYTWFSIEEVPASIKSCLVYNSVNQTITSGADTILTFDTEDHDPDGMHSTVSNTSRLVTTVGATKARVTYCVRGTGASTVQVHCQVRMNGGSGTAYGGNDAEDGANQIVHGCTGWIPVTGGTDYFEIMAFGNSGAATAAGGVNGCWAALECI